MASFFGNNEQGGGEIWSMSGINFESNLSDILERDDFTLEELLVEDDLLQEIKSRNAALLGFLSTAEVVDAMVSYVTIPVSPDAGDLAYFKYPYMSCEIFCSEVPDVLHMLVEENDGYYLTKLLSALDTEKPLNHYLAGYLEKILDMLFRQMTYAVMSYLNKKGLTVFEKFLRHVDNYSIMQIVQRLMLPHIPFSLETSDFESMTAEQRENCTCEWSFLPETCGMLISKMLDENSHLDVPAHISELLITVIQLSPPDAPFLSDLCEIKCLQPIISHIYNPKYGREDAGFSSDLLSAQSLAVTSVLDSLMSRMCEAYDPSYVRIKDSENEDILTAEQRPVSGNHSADNTSNPMLLAASRIADGHSGELSAAADAELHQQIQERVRENMAYICRDIIPVLPKIASMLRSHLIDSVVEIKALQRAVVVNAVAEANENFAAGEIPSEFPEVVDLPVPDGFIVHQSKFPFAKLGHHGFRLVKLIESVVRLADRDVDVALVASGCLEACIQLMFEYEMHSLLHLSVQRISVMIIEGGENRRLAQRNILVDAGLIEKVLDSFNRKNEDEDTWNGLVNRFAHCDKPIMGHLIYIAQVLVRAMHIETPEGIKENREDLEQSILTADGDAQGSESHNDNVWSVVEGTAPIPNQDFPTSVPATLMRSIFEDAAGLAEKWDAFVDNEYQKETYLQLTAAGDSGGSVYSASDVGGSPDHDDPAHAHVENALRALAGYSGLDGSLANRWPALDADFVIINEYEDDDDEDDDYPYGWNPGKQVARDTSGFQFGNARAGGAARYAHNDRAVMVEDTSCQNWNDEDDSSDDPDSDDAASWDKVGDGKVEDVFGPSSGDIDIFGTDAATANTGTDFFAASPTSSSGSSPMSSLGTPDSSSAGSNFFAGDIGTNASTLSPVSPGEDLFAQASGSATSTWFNTGSDFFGEQSNAFSFSSAPRPAAVPTPTPDDRNSSKHDGGKNVTFNSSLESSS